MDMLPAGCRGHRSCGQPLGGGSSGGGPPAREATGQVGGHCMVARGVNRHENRRSQQHHRPAVMGLLGVAGG